MDNMVYNNGYLVQCRYLFSDKSIWDISDPGPRRYSKLVEHSMSIIHFLDVLRYTWFWITHNRIIDIL